MGRRNRSKIEGPNLFFVTFTTLRKKEVFNDRAALETVEKTLFEVIDGRNCYLMGYVLMSNHLHLLVGTRSGGEELSQFVHTLKGLIRKRTVGNRVLWEKRFDDLVITSEKQFRIKLNYIHNNPVRKKLVDSPEKWMFSSFRFWSENKTNLHLTKDFLWMKDRELSTAESRQHDKLKAEKS
jgi:putative transposase